MTYKFLAFFIAVMLTTFIIIALALQHQTHTDRRDTKHDDAFLNASKKLQLKRYISMDSMLYHSKAEDFIHYHSAAVKVKDYDNMPLVGSFYYYRKKEGHIITRVLQNEISVREFDREYFATIVFQKVVDCIMKTVDTDTFLRTNDVRKALIIPPYKRGHEWTEHVVVEHSFVQSLSFLHGSDVIRLPTPHIVYLTSLTICFPAETFSTDSPSPLLVHNVAFEEQINGEFDKTNFQTDSYIPLVANATFVPLLRISGFPLDGRVEGVIVSYKALAMNPRLRIDVYATPSAYSVVYERRVKNMKVRTHVRQMRQCEKMLL